MIEMRVLAGYLVGGLAVGQGNAFSDVELQFIIDADRPGTDCPRVE